METGIKYYNVTQYAKLRGVTRATIYNWIKDNKFRENVDYIKTGSGSILFLVKTN